MRHGKNGRRFDMGTAQRRAMFRNLTTAVLEHGYVRTTEARAKEVRPLVEKMITLGKRGTIALAPAGAGLGLQPGRGEGPLRRARAAVREPARRLHARREAAATPG